MGEGRDRFMLLGWCMTGHCGECRIKVNGSSGVIYYCSCTCHDEALEEETG